jgi:hypothetical protein
LAVAVDNELVDTFDLHALGEEVRVPLITFVVVERQVLCPWTKTPLCTVRACDIYFHLNRGVGPSAFDITGMNFHHITEEGARTES